LQESIRLGFQQSLIFIKKTKKSFNNASILIVYIEKHYYQCFKECEITKNINSKAIPNHFYNKLLKGCQYKYLILSEKTTNMIKTGTKVKWKWGNSTAKGKVEQAYTKSVTKTIKGNKVTRNGEQNNKALYIKQEDGDFVLKLESEVSRAD